MSSIAGSKAVALDARAECDTFWLALLEETKSLQVPSPSCQSDGDSEVGRTDGQNAVVPTIDC